jgi:NDP-sugar pyrophosphorylase family protein
MDCVILAAGENTRLKGVIAPYHKPLLVYKGECLIRRLVHQALDNRDIGHIVIVCSVKNVEAISDILEDLYKEDRITYVIQPRAYGVAHAVRQGLSATSTEQVMLLCGDNYIEDGELKLITDAQKTAHTVIGGQILDRENPNVQRFARFNRKTNDLVEGGLDDEEEVYEHGKFACWVGPIIVNRKVVLARLMQVYHARVAHLLCFGDVVFVPIKAKDIGITSELIGEFK